MTEEQLSLAQSAKYLGKSKNFVRTMMEGEQLENVGTPAKPAFWKKDLEKFKSTPVDGALPPLNTPEPEEQTAPEEGEDKEEAPSFPSIAARRRRAISEAGKVDASEGQMDPEDRYEKWRGDPTIWQTGQTVLFRKLRELGSNLFIPENPPYSADMPAYHDLCDQYPGGAVLQIIIKGSPQANGQRKILRGPLTLHIGAKGEKEMSGYSNPYSFSGRQGNGQGMDPTAWFQFYEKQMSQADTRSQAQQSNWIGLLNQMGGKKEDNSAMIMMLMQMQESREKMAIAQANANKEMMVGLFSAIAPIVAAIINRKDDGGDKTIAIVIESMKEISKANQKQSEILLQAALQDKDPTKMLELIERWKGLTDEGPIGEVAKLFEATGLGAAVTSLAEAGASRLAGGSTSTTKAPALYPPDGQGQSVGVPNPYAPQGQNQTVDAAQLQAQQTAITRIKGFLDMLYPAFKDGKDPKELALTYWEQNKQHKAELLSFTPEQAVIAAQQAAPFLGYKEMVAPDAVDFMTDFSKEVYRLASTGV